MLRITIILGLLAAFPNLTIGQSRELIVNIQFDAQLSSDIQVMPATLKYNKEFAYSLTLDDTRIDAFSLGFKLLNGGLSTVDNNIYPGLFYTDGCGHQVHFCAGISWYTANDVVDLHFVTPGFLTYDNAREMNSSGWDFFNHGYSHSANNDSIHYQWQLSENQRVLKANTGIRFNICVPPNGDDGYIGPAFSQGILACISTNSAKIGVGQGADVTVPTPPEPVYWRRFINSDQHTAAILKSEIDQWALTTGRGREKWWNEYTHRVQYDHYSGSMEFPVLREYLEYMEAKYGRFGRDNGWFTGSGEVLDYLLVRDKVSVHLEKIGSLLKVHLDYSNVPQTLRHFDLSLVLKNAGNVQSISSASPMTSTYGKTADGLLVNIQLPDSFYSGIDDIASEPAAMINAFPNPTSGKLFLRVPIDLTDPKIFISDMQSRLMPAPAFSVNNGLLSMDLKKSGYHPGFYFIKLYSGKRFVGISKIIYNF